MTEASTTGATRDDHADAARYARSAGDLLLALPRDDSRPPWLLGDQADLAANHLLLDLIATDHPGDRILSEEAADDPRRLDADRVWIVDPLDGTREFSEGGRADWAVHVALWERGRGITAAAVALPALDRVLGTRPGPVLPPRADGPVRIMVSRTRAPMVAQRVARALDGLLVGMGSAGAKAMAVVLGHADAYVHAGGQYEWDSAAPVGVARAAGLHTSRIDGAELEYNRRDPWLPDLVVCRPEIAEQVLDAIAG